MTLQSVPPPPLPIPTRSRVAFPQLPHLHPLPLQRIQTRQTRLSNRNLGELVMNDRHEARMARDADYDGYRDHDWEDDAREAAGDERRQRAWH